MLPKKIGGAYSRRVVRPSVRQSFRTFRIRVRPITSLFEVGFYCYLKSDFTTISRKWSPYWDDMSRATCRSLNWKSRSQHDIAAKSCPVNNFVIWSQILQVFKRKDHHIEGRVAHKILVASLKVKVTAWHCSKIVSGP
jgi:hypothetical protein